MTPESTLAMFRAAGIQHLYYIFPLGNVTSIKTHGILPLNEIMRRGIPNASFALEEAQAWRDRFVVRLHNNTQAGVHELVPLYFNPCNPALVRRKESWKDFGIAVISITSLFPAISAWTVADGNAASRHTRYAIGPTALSCLSLQLLRASSWTTTPEHQAENKRRRCAELLVSPSVPAFCIEQVVVYDYFAAPKVHPQFEVIADARLFHNGPFAASNF